jgi:ribosomal protein S18 acetylase RimI-like enzyme
LIVNIRAATLEDRELMVQLVHELERSIPTSVGAAPEVEDEWPVIQEVIRGGTAAIAEDDGEVLGYVLARMADQRPDVVHVTDLYVREDARRRGVAKALLDVVVEAAQAQGRTHLTLEVVSDNHEALAVYRRLGFAEIEKKLAVSLDSLAGRVSGAPGESFGAVHVQTDDAPRVEAAVANYLPRLGRSGGASVTASPNGWTRVAVEPFDREVQRKLAQELSDRLGAVVVSLAVENGAVVHFFLYERNRMVDEYLSVPDYYGELPPGDALALRANPTVVSRLTGADPARVRAIARTADTAGELPPAPELYAQIADLMGLQA